MSAVNPDPELQGRYHPISSPGAQVLHPAATGLEKALADVDSNRLIRIADWIIGDQWDPYLISLNNLPYLAWAMGVNLWEDDYWSQGTKRDWVARQWLFKSLRGTPAGLRMALAQSGYEITDMVRPPQGFHAAPDLTKEQWDAWIRLMPEVRIYFAQREGTYGVDEIFVDREAAVEVAAVGFADASAISIDDGFALRGRAAIVRQAGVDTPMYSIQYAPATAERGAVDYERLSTYGTSELDLISDADFVAEDRYVEAAPETERPKLFTLRLDRGYSHDLSTLSLSMVVPDLAPITPRYERDSDIGNAGTWMFVGDFWVDDQNAGYATYADREDGGDMLLADRIYLLDPAVTEPMTEGVCFADISRVGIPVQTAELQIDLNTTEVADSTFLEASFADVQFVTPEDDSHRERAFRAIVAAKSLRDTILVSFAPKRPAQMNDYLPAASSYDAWIAQPL